MLAEAHREINQVAVNPQQPGHIRVGLTGRRGGQQHVEFRILVTQGQKVEGFLCQPGDTRFQRRKHIEGGKLDSALPAQVTGIQAVPAPVIRLPRQFQPQQEVPHFGLTRQDNELIVNTQTAADDQRAGSRRYQTVFNGPRPGRMIGQDVGGFGRRE